MLQLSVRPSICLEVSPEVLWPESEKVTFLASLSFNITEAVDQNSYITTALGK